MLVAGVVALTVSLVRKPAVAVVETPLSVDAARLTADARAQRSLADAARAELDSARSEWRAWLAAAGLDAQGDDPAAVRALLEELAERQRMLDEAARYREIAEREQNAADEWALRLVDAVRRYDDSAGQMVPLSEATALAARAKRDLDVARTAAAEHQQLTRDLEAARAERARLGRPPGRIRRHRAGSGCTSRARSASSALPALRALLGARARGSRRGA